MKRFINVRHAGKVETIDEVESSDFRTEQEFKNRIAQVVGSHRMYIRQGHVYSSQRPANNW